MTGLPPRLFGRLFPVQDLQEFKERMALAPLPSVDAEELLELVSTRETVFVLSTEVRGWPGETFRDRGRR